MYADKEKKENEVALETYRQATTEKQEEWERGLEDIVKQWGDGDGSYIGTLPHTELYDFISQLLSERTFTKEELAILHWWGCVIRRNKDIEMVKDEKLLHERLGKLLNSKE